MGILGKLKFWKKGDDLALGGDLAMPPVGNLPTPNDELGMQSPGLPQTPPFQAPEPRMESYREPPRPYMQQQQPQMYGTNRDLELVSAKLDALRATLENINQRLANLERAAYGEEDNRKRGW